MKLHNLSQEPQFWHNSQKAKEVLSEIQRLDSLIDSVKHIEKEINEAKELLVLFSNQELIHNDLQEYLEKIQKDLQDLEKKSLFLTPEDSKKALLTIHPGAGGVESCDWAEMLFRMYLKYFQKKDFKYQILDYQPAEEAGIKDAVV
ncbi:MAG: PCRF domain-containing protein, partial [candidate division WOR-3 bacterium]